MKTALAALVLVLAGASTASAQSLLGDSGASPYDPLPRAPLRKRDHVQILVQERPDRVSAIAAEVVDIRPNGAVVLQAILRRKGNDVDEVLRVTGEAAAEAVVRNAVRLEKLVNLSVGYDGRGAAGGLLGKLWPF